MRTEAEIREQIDKLKVALNKIPAQYQEGRDTISDQIDALSWVIGDSNGVLYGDEYAKLYIEENNG